MAKKGQAIQLQTEVNNDEEWEKLLQRDGLIVIDVYSDWCGPCSGMTATLKKLKLEIGGEVLQLAVAKSDKITALERFRNKSEPTWMLVVNGKLVNFMFGANAPKLTRLITEELKKEEEARAGRRERVKNEIGELTDEEKERLEVIAHQQQEAQQKEVVKAAKELRERRTAECHNILETLQNLGVIIIFPHARSAYQEAFGDLFGEAALTISQTEKYEMTPEVLEELFYFGEIPFDDEAIEELLNNTCLVLLVKPMVARDLEEETDDLINRIVYGAMKKAPGSPDSVARQLAKLPMHPDEEVAEKPHDRVAIWTPENDFIKATALRLFFRRITEVHLIAEPEPTPPHYAVVFEAMRRNEVKPLMEKYEDEVLRYGFFTSDIPEQAKVIAKSTKKYEKAPLRAPEQKMVVQLSKRKSECVLAFAQMKPLYISPNAKEGERECKMFFPDDYDEPPEEEDEEAVQSTTGELSERPSLVPDESEAAEVGSEMAESLEGTQAEISGDGAEIIRTEDGEVVDTASSGLQLEASVLVVPPDEAPPEEVGEASLPPLEAKESEAPLESPYQESTEEEESPAATE